MTAKHRPDMLETADLTEKERKFLEEINNKEDKIEF